jgi:hypothetical protein
VLKPLLNAVRAAIVLLAHLLLGSVAAVAVRSLDALWGWLFQEREPMVANLFPLHYVLEIGDAAIFLLFAGFGCYEAVRALVGRDG